VVDLARQGGLQSSLPEIEKASGFGTRASLPVFNNAEWCYLQVPDLTTFNVVAKSFQSPFLYRLPFFKNNDSPFQVSDILICSFYFATKLLDRFRWFFWGQALHWATLLQQSRLILAGVDLLLPKPLPCALSLWIGFKFLGLSRPLSS
jgi:hypothetical protein